MTRYYKYIQLKIIRITNLHSKENYTKQKIHPNNIQRIERLKIKKTRKKISVRRMTTPNSKIKIYKLEIGEGGRGEPVKCSKFLVSSF